MTGPKQHGAEALVALEAGNSVVHVKKVGFQ